LLQANQLLGQLSFVDRLTGVANRRRFEEVLALEWSRAARSELPLSLLIIDIDHFKLLNDRYGHIRGDECLVIAVQALSACLSQPAELLARYGGEEFVAILPGADSRTAFTIAERMRASIEALEIANEDAPSERMTVSIGVVSNTFGEMLSESTLFALADKALYEAKGRGRNRVEISGLEEGVTSRGFVL
jgi:diguanylate cyclase (GGDEF)-like protein